jgi:hypothetical protein
MSDNEPEVMETSTGEVPQEEEYSEDPPNEPRRTIAGVRLLIIPPGACPLLANNYFMANKRYAHYLKDGYSKKEALELSSPETELKRKDCWLNTFVFCPVCCDYVELRDQLYEQTKGLITKNFHFKGQFTCPACLGQEERKDQCMEFEDDEEKEDATYEEPGWKETHYDSDGESIEEEGSSGEEINSESSEDLDNSDSEDWDSNVESMSEDEMENLGWESEMANAKGYSEPLKKIEE